MNNLRRKQIRALITKLNVSMIDKDTLYEFVTEIADDEMMSIESLMDYPQFEMKASDMEMNNHAPLVEVINTLEDKSLKFEDEKDFIISLLTESLI